jgi:hypothetical protein
MGNPSLPQGERGYELLLEHCTALVYAVAPRPPAFLRLERELGGELARMLVVALATRRAERSTLL